MSDFKKSHCIFFSSFVEKGVSLQCLHKNINYVIVCGFSPNHEVTRRKHNLGNEEEEEEPLLNVVLSPCISAILD